MTKYEVKYTSIFKRNLKKLIKQHKNLNSMFDVINKLANNEKLEFKFKNHKLRDDGTYKNCFECHIEPDWLLIYQYNEEKLILVLVNSGTHSELFNK